MSECLLDSLPDEILNGILSFLPFKDASKACLLARRWRFLSLDFSDLDFEASKQYLSCIDVDGRKIEALYGPVSVNYANWVDRVISGVRSRQQSNKALRGFHIRYYLDDSFSQKVESWLRFSLERGVEALELDCCFDDDDKNHTVYMCRFPLSIIQKPELFPNLRLLKSLSLSRVAINSDSLTSLLLSCEFLERLRLCRIQYLFKVNITGEVSRLKYMDFSGCKFEGFITIWAPTPYLLSLRYSSSSHLVHIEHAPLLEDLFISHSGSIPNIVKHRLWRFSSQLKSLRLDINCTDWDGYDYLTDLKLRRLQHLKISLYCLSRSDISILQRNLCGLATLIKGCASIRYLTLIARNGINEELKIRKEFDDLDLKFLRIIEYVGFRGGKVDSELMIRLTNAISPMEKLIIDCRPETIRMAFADYRSAMTKIKEWKISALELKKGIRAGVEMEFLD